MGNYIGTDDVVLLFDNYQTDSQNLHTSFKLAGKNYPVAVIEDDGFLPDDVMSVFGFFLGDFASEHALPGKARYFNQINVPEYWEISGNNSGGKVHDLGKERGRIFYAEPAHKRLVKIVDWYDERGVVRSSDHYNKYGALYARTIFNAKGQRVNKSYFSPSGKEMVMENYVTKNIILNDGDVVRIFTSREEFVCYFLKAAGLDDRKIYFNTLSTSFFVSQRMNTDTKGDVLFWQEPIREEIPGNMRIILNRNAHRTCKIMVQKKDAYEKLLALGAPSDIIHQLGYIYPFKKENQHKPEALICTNSDWIAQCRELVEALPEMHFYIVALTEMSSKLMSMDTYPNVTLYPGVKMHVFEELLERCDFYLDINYEGEILSAVRNAFLHNHLILAFKETLHNGSFVAEEHIYGTDDTDKMIACIKGVLGSENAMAEHLEKQHRTALLENPGKYCEI